LWGRQNRPERRHDGKRRLGIDDEVVRARGNKRGGEKRWVSILTTM
jgi:hypothetical protein